MSNIKNLIDEQIDLFIAKRIAPGNIPNMVFVLEFCKGAEDLQSHLNDSFSEYDAEGLINERILQRIFREVKGV